MVIATVVRRRGLEFNRGFNNVKEVGPTCSHRRQLRVHIHDLVGLVFPF